MLGVFMSLDFFLFYMFWEVMLVPMYFLIGVWGSDRRLYAAIKFFLYTLVGSVIMLLGILALYFKAGGGTFDIPTLLASASQFDTHTQVLLFWAFFFAFAIKVPMFPFHTWLPDAHTEAPTAGSVILAGVLLKMGTYGFIRFSLAAAAAGSGGPPQNRHDHAGRFDDRHFVRRAGLHDAEGHEEADRLQLGQPPGILHAGNFRADAARAFRQRDAADQPRTFDRRAVLADRRALRTAAHALDLGIRRALHAHAEFRGHLYDRHAQFAGLAAAQRIHRRVHHPARHLRSQHQVHGVGRRSASFWAPRICCGSTSA